MFFWTNPNIIESDEGFSVQFFGPTSLTYREGGHQLRIVAESLATPHGLVIVKSSIVRWVPPHAAEINDQARERIVDNIRRAFAARGIEVVVQ